MNAPVSACLSLGLVIGLFAVGCSSPEHPPISPNDTTGMPTGDGGRPPETPTGEGGAPPDAALDPAKCGGDRVPIPEPNVVETSAAPPPPNFDGGTLGEGSYRVVTRVIYHLNAQVEGPAGLRTVFTGNRYTSILTRGNKSPTLYFGGTWATHGNAITYVPDCPLPGAGYDFFYNADTKSYQTNIGNDEVYTFVKE